MAIEMFDGIDKIQKALVRKVEHDAIMGGNVTWYWETQWNGVAESLVSILRNDETVFRMNHCGNEYELISVKATNEYNYECEATVYSVLAEYQPVDG